VVPASGSRSTIGNRGQLGIGRSARHRDLLTPRLKSELGAWRQEIADQLSVSANTVGMHLRSIYAKLGVRDRSSAVQRTRELRAAGGRSAALARLTGSR
jgi:DNA-binding NarL/FixJ family response regulator